MNSSSEPSWSSRTCPYTVAGDHAIYCFLEFFTAHNGVVKW
jgi:hypothetical protein